MKVSKCLAVSAVIAIAAGPAVFASGSNRTFRTEAAVGAVFQTPNPLATNTELLAVDAFAGHDLVSLAVGTNLVNVLTNQLLALEIDCGSDQASLMVFDTSTQSNVVIIATSTKITALTGQDNPTAAGPNHERFVIEMGVNTNGFILGGSLTIAGRAYLDPATGCPRAVLVDTDRIHDRLFADVDVKDTDLKGEKDKFITGDAHLIGEISLIFADGSTNTVLLPFGQLTMRRQLLP
jgi:hypothetical protein